MGLAVAASKAGKSAVVIDLDAPAALPPEYSVVRPRISTSFEILLGINLPLVSYQR